MTTMIVVSRNNKVSNYLIWDPPEYTIPHCWFTIVYIIYNNSNNNNNNNDNNNNNNTDNNNNNNNIYIYIYMYICNMYILCVYYTCIYPDSSDYNGR